MDHLWQRPRASRAAADEVESAPSRSPPSPSLSSPSPSPLRSLLSSLRFALLLLAVSLFGISSVYYTAYRWTVLSTFEAATRRGEGLLLTIPQYVAHVERLAGGGGGGGGGGGYAGEEGDLPFIPILMPVYGRPDYLQRVVDGLRNCSGIENAVVVVSQDGSNEDVAALMEDLGARGPLRGRVLHYRHTRPFLNIPSYVKDSEFATSKNIEHMLTFAFEHLGASAAIVLEDDLVPAVDFYEYFHWAYRQFLTRPELDDVVTVSAWNMSSRADAAQGSRPFAFARTLFNSWGWMMPRKHWPLVRDGWTFFGNWDIHFRESIQAENGLVTIAPELSRVRNIGLQGINFRINDPQSLEAKLYNDVYISPKRLDYAAAPPPVVHPVCTVRSTSRGGESCFDVRNPFPDKDLK